MKKKIHIYFFVWTNCLGMLLWFIVFLLCPPKKAAYSICTVGLYICFSQQMWGCAKCPATFITLPFMDFFLNLTQMSTIISVARNTCLSTSKVKVTIWIKGRMSNLSLTEAEFWDKSGMWGHRCTMGTCLDYYPS
jgi:hypothetical protein